MAGVVRPCPIHPKLLSSSPDCGVRTLSDCTSAAPRQPGLKKVPFDAPATTCHNATISNETGRGSIEDNLMNAWVLVTMLLSPFSGFDQTRPQPDTGTTMGDCWLPTLVGWEKSVYRGDPLNSLTFSRKVDGTDLMFKFFFNRTPQGLKSYTAADLAILDRGRRSTFSAMEQDPTLNFKATFLESKPCTYRSWPAFLERIRWGKEGKGRSDSKSLAFVDGRNDYSFNITIGSLKPSKRVKAEAESAWNRMTAGMRYATERNHSFRH
jgi:hypothetical protein